jgi:hypothetical protein
MNTYWYKPALAGNGRPSLAHPDPGHRKEVA